MPTAKTHININNDNEHNNDNNNNINNNNNNTNKAYLPIWATTPAAPSPPPGRP